MTSEFTVAIHGLVYLHHRGETASSEVLAQNICTNPARVRKVMAKLKKAGLVDTKEGAVGGYQSARAPETVTLCEIAEALGERLCLFLLAQRRKGPALFGGLRHGRGDGCPVSRAGYAM